MLVRDDAIPRYVAEGICELGIVGLNVLEERSDSRNVSILARLGFREVCEIRIFLDGAASAGADR